MQQVWLAFIVGLILGWLIEWIIDWQFWRKTATALRQENVQLRAALAQTQTQENHTAKQAPEEDAERPTAPAGEAAVAATVVPDEGE